VLLIELFLILAIFDAWLVVCHEVP
jgi:hypothetical protein